MKKCFLFVTIFVLVMSMFLIPVNAAEGEFSISTPLLYQSDHTHAVLYVSNGVQTQCIVMEHEYWDNPNFNENLDFWVEYYPVLFSYPEFHEFGPHIQFLGFDNDLYMYVYDAFDGSLIFKSKYVDLPSDSYRASYYEFPNSSYTYVYKFNDYNMDEPVVIGYDYKLNSPLPINEIEYGKVYNVVRIDDDERLINVSALFYAFLNWISNIVNTITSSTILMLTFGIFITGGVIGLTYRLIHK